jgi:hypothetical protein
MRYFLLFLYIALSLSPKEQPPLYRFMAPDSLYGFKDYAGKVIILPVYNKASSLSKGYASHV